MTQKAISEERQAQIVEAYHKHGNKTKVCEELGVSYNTVIKYLRKANVDDKPIASGRVSYITPTTLPLPNEGTQRYVLTCAQNNTKLHEGFWRNLVAYSEFMDARLMVSRFTYNKSSYSSNKSVKPGHAPTADDKAGAWWDPKLDPYICDDPERHDDCRYELAPGLMWCAEMNIIPTQQRPLTGLHAYTGRASSIFPHAKMAMESVAAAKNEAAKLTYTTGCVTKRNYIAKKTGLMAEFHHAYGALIVEVSPDGSWWVRQLNGDSDGTFYDIPDIGEGGAIKVRSGKVETGQRVEAVNWGDVHASEIDPEAIITNWASQGCIIDDLRPRYQFMHDLLSFRSRSHHEMKKFGRMFQKYVDGIESVENEISETASVVHTAHRDFCHMVVVNSNHDRHGERWLDETDYRQDLLNAEFYLEAQLERVRSMKQRRQWDFHTWALKRCGVPNEIKFLDQDESFVICKKYSGGIECGMHGDEGPNGARGSTANLRKLGRRVNKGHDHQATIMDGVYSAGACALDFPYMSGPTSHTISHIVTYPNGKRTIITCWQDGWRGPQT